MRTPTRWAALALLLLLPLLCGCYASSVVAAPDRAVAEQSLPAEWRPAARADFDGLFESVAISGDAALSLRKVYYWFAPDGRYTGAALVDGDDGPAFQTLQGRFAVGPDGLALDDSAPVAAGAAGDHLRIAAPTGTLVLRRSRAW